MSSFKDIMDNFNPKDINPSKFYQWFYINRFKLQEQYEKEIATAFDDGVIHQLKTPDIIKYGKEYYEETYKK